MNTRFESIMSKKARRNNTQYAQFMVTNTNTREVVHNKAFFCDNIQMVINELRRDYPSNFEIAVIFAGNQTPHKAAPVSCQLQTIKPRTVFADTLRISTDPT